MSTFWQGLLLVPIWQAVLIGLGLLVALIMLVGAWRREALGYIRKGAQEIGSSFVLIVLCCKGMAWLWRFGREKAIARWPRLGTKSDAFGWLAAGSIAVGATSVNLAMQNLHSAPEAPTVRATWTTDKDWSEWELHGLEAIDGSLQLTNIGGRGTWTKLPDQPSLAGGWQKIAATTTDVWLSDGGHEVMQLDLTTKKWVKHEHLIAPSTQVGALWAKGREAVVLSTYGAAIHWTGTTWDEPEYISKEDGEWLEAQCAFGDTWNDLWVGSRGAIFHRENGDWKMESSPSSGIGRFTGITKHKGRLWAINEEGLIWRRNDQNASWSVVFTGPFRWAGISSSGEELVTFDEIGLSYKMIGDNPTHFPVGLLFKDIDRHIAVGTLNQGRNSVDLRTRQPIGGPTDDDLIQVSTVDATSAWAVSSSALYRYGSEPKYVDQGHALIIVPRPLNKALMLTDLPKDCRADVMYSNDGKHWQSNLQDVPGNDSFILLRVSLMSESDKKTPFVRALTLK